MQPEIRITIEGGCVIDATATVPGLSVLIYDIDAERAGDDPRSTLPADLEEDIDPSLFGPLTEQEVRRFELEMESNFEGHKTTVEVLLNIIGNSPQAALALREWLSEAEQATRELEEDFAAAEDFLSDEDDPAHDALLNNLARNGPWS
jgi:hypothetical protein